VLHKEPCTTMYTAATPRCATQLGGATVGYPGTTLKGRGKVTHVVTSTSSAKNQNAGSSTSKLPAGGIGTNRTPSADSNPRAGKCSSSSSTLSASTRAALQLQTRTPLASPQASSGRHVHVSSPQLSSGRQVHVGQALQLSSCAPSTPTLREHRATHSISQSLSVTSRVRTRCPSPLTGQPAEAAKGCAPATPEQRKKSLATHQPAMLHAGAQTLPRSPAKTHRLLSGPGIGNRISTTSASPPSGTRLGNDRKPRNPKVSTSVSMTATPDSSNGVRKPHRKMVTSMSQCISSECLSIGCISKELSGSILEESNYFLSVYDERLAELAKAKTENALKRFFQDVRCNSANLAVLSQPHMDVAMYWEKRRVQNLLRRVLEALQEWGGVEGDAWLNESGQVFDKLAHLVEGSGTLDCEGPDDPQLDEQQFHDILEKAGLWPRDLGGTDRSEVFYAVVTPSLAIARSTLERAEQKATLGRRSFFEGFAFLPYNLPDFPVPTHLNPGVGQMTPSQFTEEQSLQVAQAVATIFCMERTGLDRIKDFFMTGLVSLEEIQAALPRLMPYTLVEEAVLRIIRGGGAHFTNQDWQDFVTTVRTPEACGATESNSQSGVKLRGKEPIEQKIQDVSTSYDMHSQMPVLASPIAPKRSPLLTDSEVSIEQESITLDSKCPLTTTSENLLSCSYQSEDMFSSTKSLGAPATMVVNWNTVGQATSGQKHELLISSHQADEGAGARQTWGTSSIKRELAAAKAASAGKRSEGSTSGPDPVAWISLDLHNECSGPYLAHAFVRCCQLYEMRRMKDQSTKSFYD